MHNNENTGSVGQTSITTGLVLDIDFHTKNVSLNRQMWNQQQPVFSTSQGSFQSLDNGHVLLGQGSTPLIEEYDENGALVMSAQFGYGNFTMESYRAYRYPWVGRPATTPSVRACRRDGGDDDPAKGGKVAVYVSWNGATDIQAWKILAGPDPDKLSVVNTVRRNGYETTVWIQDVGDHVIAEAIGGPNGGVKSNVVTAEACV